MNNLYLVAETSSSMNNMIFFPLMFAVLYFFMIRPQIKKQKNEKKFQKEITKGSKVVMTSGIHGKIVEFIEKDNTVIIETTAGKMKFERSSISLEMSKKYTEETSK